MLLGANGAIGRTLGPLLGARGVPYRVVGRTLLALQVRFHEQPLCEVMVWDPAEPGAFAHAFGGAETAVYLIGTPLWKFSEHLALTERALKAAQDAGIQRFLLVSSNWSYSRPKGGERIREDSPRDPETAKGRIRREQEDRVLAAHLAGRFATGVLRMADLYGPKVEASHLWSVFQAAKRGTQAQVLGPIDSPHEFLYVPDAAETILRLLAEDRAWDALEGQVWNLGGAGVSTIRTMVELIFATEGKPANYNVPGRLMLKVVRSLNPYIREQREMQYLLDDGLLLDDRRLLALLSHIPRTPYAEGVRYTLSLR